MSTLKKLPARPKTLARSPRRSVDRRRIFPKASIAGSMAPSMTATGERGEASNDRDRSIDRARAAAEYFLATRARRHRIADESNAELDETSGSSEDCQPGEWERARELEDSISDAFREDDEAELALVDAIRNVAPARADRGSPHIFVHRDGRAFVAIPDDLVIDMPGQGRCRVLVVEPGRWVA